MYKPQLLPLRNCFLQLSFRRAAFCFVYSSALFSFSFNVAEELLPEAVAVAVVVVVLAEATSAAVVVLNT